MTMKDETTKQQQEWLSALADGELQGETFVRAVDWAGTDEGRMCWQHYHLIGEVLRASALTPVCVHMCDPALLVRLRAQIAHETHEARESQPLRQPQEQWAHAPLAQLQPVQLAGSGGHAGGTENGNGKDDNGDPAWRWKLAVGCASLATLTALGWNATRPGGGGISPSPPPMQAQYATAPAQAKMPAQQPHILPEERPQTAPDILRDPRLDELLAAHQQFGTTTALQMPAGFLRNATFERQGQGQGRRQH